MPILLVEHGVVGRILGQGQELGVFVQLIFLFLLLGSVFISLGVLQ